MVVQINTILMASNYPPGAEHDSRAPWNEKENELEPQEREYEPEDEDENEQGFYGMHQALESD